MKRLALTIVFLGIPAFAFAQDGGEIGLDMDLRTILAVMISGVGVPLAVQLLKHFWPQAPTWLKAIAGPVLVPALMYVASMASTALGFPVDLSEIIAVISGVSVAAGIGSSVAFTLGKKKV